VIARKPMQWSSLFAITAIVTLPLLLYSSSASAEKKPAVGLNSSPTNTGTKPASNKANGVVTNSGVIDKIYFGADGKPAGTGSPDRPASEVYRIARGVHPKALSTPGLPKDKFGLIDWNSMVDKNIIRPAESLEGDKEAPPLLDLDILIKSKGDYVNNVLFRHKPHVYWLDCKNCHTGIFVMAKGKNKMSMQGIVKGEWCGRCHGKVSFPLTDCNRCHSRPKR